MIRTSNKDLWLSFAYCCALAACKIDVPETLQQSDRALAGSRAERAGSSGIRPVQSSEAGKGGSSAPRAGAPADEPVAAGKSAAGAPTADPKSFGWTELRGETLGSGTASNDSLRKTIKLTVKEAGGYTLGSALALRSSTTSQATSVVIEVRNSSQPLRCFVKAEPLVWKTAQGEAIERSSTFSYVSGSIGLSSAGETTTCLGPGETGYLMQIDVPKSGQPSHFESLDSIELSLTSNNSDYARPGHQLQGQSYALKKTSSLDELSVTFVNRGEKPAPLDGLSLLYLLVDDAGKALDWGYLDAATSGDVASGKALVGTTDIYFAGSGTRLLVLADY